MKTISILFSAATLLFISGCRDNELDPNIPVAGNYLPTNLDDVYFLREQFSDVNLQNRYFYDTLKVAFIGDTLIGNHTYQAFQFYQETEPKLSDLFRLFRKEGSKYLNLPLGGESEGHVFLDVQKPEGSSWVHVSKTKETKTIYTVRAINSVRTIHGVDFRNVIEMEKEVMTKNFNDQFYRVSLTQTYYAKDLGEIYSTSAWFVYTGAIRTSFVR